MSKPEPYDLSWLLTGDQARSESIPRATAGDELFIIESNPTHIEWGERRSNGRYQVSYHIGYQTNWGAVALCRVGNDGIPSECRCSPWHPKPTPPVPSGPGTPERTHDEDSRPHHLDDHVRPRFRLRRLSLVGPASGGPDRIRPGTRQHVHAHHPISRA